MDKMLFTKFSLPGRKNRFLIERSPLATNFTKTFDQPKKLANIVSTKNQGMLTQRQLAADGGATRKAKSNFPARRSLQRQNISDIRFGCYRASPTAKGQFSASPSARQLHGKLKKSLQIRRKSEKKPKLLLQNASRKYFENSRVKITVHTRQRLNEELWDAAETGDLEKIKALLKPYLAYYI